MWKQAVKASRFDLESEPLFHNNTIFPCWNADALKQVASLKQMAQGTRKSV
jgi:hypothetical protein